MKLWMSGEVMADVADAYRVCRKQLEDAINSKLLQGPGITGFGKWAVIAIIRPDDHKDYQEVSKLDKARGVAEFRLKVDHASFLQSNERERCMLLLKMLDRSLEKMIELKAPRTDVEAVQKLLHDL